VPEEDSDVEILDAGTSTDAMQSAAVPNMFDCLDALPPPRSSDHHTELDRYLTTDIEHVTDAIAWWHEHHATYPCLSRMALNYLSVPGVHCTVGLTLFLLLTSPLATSIDVECLFSCGQLLLSHVRSRLSVDSTRALLCLSAWSHLGLVKNEDVLKVGVLPEVDDEDETEGGTNLD